MRFLSVLLLLFVLAPTVLAQREGVLQIDDAFSHTLVRQHALGRLPGGFVGAQPLSAYQARAYADTVLAYEAGLGRADRMLLGRLTGRTAGPGIGGVQRVAPFLYADGNSFYSARDVDYGLEVSPLTTLSYGRARQSALEGREASLSIWQNTRGARAAGHIGAHIYFEARVQENQRRVVRPEFIRKTNTAPRLGNTKLQEDSVYDYFVATGLVGFKSKFFDVRFGRDRNRWGFGQSSLILSDYATVYDQLQIRTQFWRLHYTNLFARISSLRPQDDLSESLVPRKYSVFHRLALDLPGRVQVELFEAVVFATDSTGADRRVGFDLAYLNPIVFYRAVEHDLGSPDNALLGGGISWIATPGVKLYAQGILDELTVSEFANDWWGNKWGYTLGLFLVDPGIGQTRLRDFDLRLEYARLRPFIYAHRNESSAFVHYGDLLGHPAGPNASDVALFLNYRPWPRLATALNLAHTHRGRNPEGLNFGADPISPTMFRDSDDRMTTTFQGVRQDALLVEARVGYEILPELFAEAVLLVESVDDAETGLDRYVAPFLSLRWGVPFTSLRY